MSNPRHIHEPAAIWSPTRRIVFDSSIPGSENVILSQASAALQALCWRIDDLMKLLNFIPNLVNVFPHPQIPHVLSEIFFHQGIASTILFNGSDRGDKENVNTYKSRIFRYNYVREFCEKSNLSNPILSNRQMRNQITHIDEHLLRAMREPNTGWFVDTAILDRLPEHTPHGIKVRYCRTFIVSEGIFIHFDNEVNAQALKAEAQNVLACVFGLECGDPPQVVGSQPAPLTPDAPPRSTP